MWKSLSYKKGKDTYFENIFIVQNNEKELNITYHLNGIYASHIKRMVKKGWVIDKKSRVLNSVTVYYVRH